jgi:hypothetical protein
MIVDIHVHPVLWGIVLWLEIALALFLYFQTYYMRGDQTEEKLDESWKIPTALMWPILLVCYIGAWTLALVTWMQTLLNAKRKPK